MSGFLATFPQAVAALSEKIVDALINLYVKVTSELLPTPSKSHYTFNLRDMSKVVQGRWRIVPLY